MATIGVVSNPDQKILKSAKLVEIDGEEKDLRQEVWR